MRARAITPRALKLLGRLRTRPQLTTFGLTKNATLTLCLKRHIDISLSLFAPRSFSTKRLRTFLSRQCKFRATFEHPSALGNVVSNIGVSYVTRGCTCLQRPCTRSKVHLCDVRSVITVGLSTVTSSNSQLGSFISVTYLSAHVPFCRVLGYCRQGFPRTGIVHPFGTLACFSSVSFNRSVIVLGFRCS